MSGGEIAVLVFIIAAFVVFGVTLAWVSHADASEQAARRPAHSGRQEPMGTYYQGADG